MSKPRRLRDYRELGRMFQVARNRSPRKTQTDIGKRYGLSVGTLRLAWYFSEYFRRSEAAKLDALGVSWRKAVELVRLKKKRDRQALYGKLIRGNLSKQELAANVVRMTGKQSRPRLPSDPIAFAARIRNDLTRITAISEEAEFVLQTQRLSATTPSSHEWRKASAAHEIATLTEQIDQAVGCLKKLRSEVFKAGSKKPIRR